VTSSTVMRRAAHGKSQFTRKGGLIYAETLEGGRGDRAKGQGFVGTIGYGRDGTKSAEGGREMRRQGRWQNSSRKEEVLKSTQEDTPC